MLIRRGIQENENWVATDALDGPKYRASLSGDAILQHHNSIYGESGGVFRTVPFASVRRD
jgi:hypothetical protein